MRPTLTLAVVFLAFAAFPMVAVPGAHHTPTAFVLVGLLALSGLLVLTKSNAAYYLALFSASVVTVAGMVSWAGVGAGKWSLPINPLLEVVLGLYLLFRVALAHRTFGPQPEKKPRLALDEDEPAAP